eukprot:5273545-Lingulodinium_polyedra.AAC.1
MFVWAASGDAALSCVQRAPSVCKAITIHFSRIGVAAVSSVAGLTAKEGEHDVEFIKDLLNKGRISRGASFFIIIAALAPQSFCRRGPSVDG